MWSCLVVADVGSPQTSVGGVQVVAVDDLVAWVEEIRHRVGHRYVSVAAPEALAGPVALQMTLAAGHLPEMELAGLISPHAPLAILSALISMENSSSQTVDAQYLGAPRTDGSRPLLQYSECQ